MSRVAVAMSGGVDSSVAALLLAREGHDVIGVTMKLMPDPLEIPLSRDLCCSFEATQRAKSTCYQLGIPHYTLNLSRQFDRFVIRDFCEAYACGITPNPCLRCNERIKFGALLQLLIAACDIDRLATGHYAIREPAGRRTILRRGVDSGKDQSYALYGLTQQQLARAMFPLGQLHKDEVRELAQQHDLPTAETSESQDLCFVPGGDYREFLHRSITPTSGPICDQTGEQTGTHDGLHNYTVGQRCGLGKISNERSYVTRLDTQSNTVSVGNRDALPRRWCLLDDVNYVGRPPPPSDQCIEGRAEVRHRSTPTVAVLRATSASSAIVHLPLNPHPLAPGQSLVLYRDDAVMAGGVIVRSWN